MSTVAAWIQEYEDNFALDWLATNPNPNLISYLKENPEKTNWEYLSQNANAKRK